MLNPQKLKSHYDEEILLRKKSPEDSRLLSRHLKKLDPKSFQLAFGCADLHAHLNLEMLQSKSILDFGCGAGSDLAFIGQMAQPKEALGIDLSPKMVEAANQLFQEKGLSDFRARSISLEDVATESMDLILSNAVIHLNEDKAPIFRELFRILKPGGVLLFADFMVSGELPPVLREEFNASEGAFLFGGLSPIRAYRDSLMSSGFEQMESLMHASFDPRQELQELISPKLQEALKEVDFFIEIMRVQKQADSIISQRFCPSCNQEKAMRHIPSLNCQIHPLLFQRFMEGSFPACLCPDCGFSMEAEPWQMHDMQKRLYAFVFPSSFQMQRIALEREILQPVQKRLPPGYAIHLCFGSDELRSLCRNSA